MTFEEGTLIDTNHFCTLWSEVSALLRETSTYTGKVFQRTLNAYTVIENRRHEINYTLKELFTASFAMGLFLLANLHPNFIGSGRVRIVRGFPFRHSEVPDPHIRGYCPMPEFDELNYTACLLNLLCSVIFAVVLVATTRGMRSLLKLIKSHDLDSK